MAVGILQVVQEAPALDKKKLDNIHMTRASIWEAGYDVEVGKWDETYPTQHLRTPAVLTELHNTAERLQIMAGCLELQARSVESTSNQKMRKERFGSAEFSDKQNRQRFQARASLLRRLLRTRQLIHHPTRGQTRPGTIVLAARNGAVEDEAQISDVEFAKVITVTPIHGTLPQNARVLDRRERLSKVSLSVKLRFEADDHECTRRLSEILTCKEGDDEAYSTAFEGLRPPRSRNHHHHQSECSFLLERMQRQRDFTHYPTPEQMRAGLLVLIGFEKVTTALWKGELYFANVACATPNEHAEFNLQRTFGESGVSRKLSEMLVCVDGGNVCQDTTAYHEYLKRMAKHSVMYKNRSSPQHCFMCVCADCMTKGSADDTPQTCRKCGAEITAQSATRYYDLCDCCDDLSCSSETDMSDYGCRYADSPGFGYPHTDDCVF